MLNINKLISLTLLVAFGFVEGLLANDAVLRPLVVGVSPFYAKEQRKVIVSMLRDMVYNRLPMGTNVIAMDAWNIRRITSADLSIPVVDYDSPEARDVAVAGALAELDSWAENAPSEPPVGLPWGVIKLDAFFESAAAEASGLGLAPNIILVGNPVLQNPDAPAYGFSPGRFPSDGHLNIRTVSESPWAVVDPTRLKGARVYMTWVGTPNFYNDLHRVKIRRYLSLWTEAQGAKFMAFSDDNANVFNKAAVGASMLNITEHIDPKDVELVVMHELVEAPKPVVRKTIVPDFVDLSKLPIIPIGKIGFAAIWWARDPAKSKGQDLDLYVSRRDVQGRRGEEVFYDKVKYNDLVYHRDLRSASKTTGTQQAGSNWTDTWELVDADAKAGDHFSVCVNAYALTTPVEGVVRVIAGERILEYPFKFEQAKGNSGRESEVREQSKFWICVPVDDILAHPEAFQIKL